MTHDLQFEGVFYLVGLFPLGFLIKDIKNWLMQNEVQFQECFIWGFLFQQLWYYEKFHEVLRKILHKVL